ncbi:MAG: T9SS type A sorting domain-containing protein [Flavobacteriales bacterium]
MKLLIPLLLFLSSFVYGQDTLYIYQGDTTTSHPIGKLPIDTSNISDTTWTTDIEETILFKEDSIHIYTNPTFGEYTATTPSGSERIYFKMYRVPSVPTQNTSIYLNSVIIKSFLVNALDNIPYFDSTIAANTGDVFKARIDGVSGNSGSFLVDITMFSLDTTLTMEVVTTVYITFDDPKSVSNLSSSKLNIYPNPVSDYLLISKTVDFKIYDLAGVLIHEGSKTSVIDMRNIPSGLYVLSTLEMNTVFLRE